MTTCRNITKRLGYTKNPAETEKKRDQKEKEENQKYGIMETT